MRDTLIAIIVPLLLILGIIYGGSGISGYAVAEPKKTFGDYTLDPSFSISMDYEMQKEYDDAVQKAKAAVEKCKNERKIGGCLNSEIKSKGYACEKNDLEDIFYDFIDKLRECQSLKEENVICRFFAEKAEVGADFRKALRLDMRDDGDEINFELKDDSSVLIEDSMAMPDMHYIYDFNDKSKILAANSVSLELDYTLDEPKIKRVRSSDGKAFSESILYKKDGKAMFVEKGVESSFKTLESVNLPRKRGAKFCIKSDKKVTAMDTDNEAKERNVAYKFAVTYPELDIPPAVKDLDARDKLKAEKSIIINWTKAMWDDNSDVLNLDHYNVYCSGKEFEKNDNGELKLEGMKPARAFSYSRHDEWKIEIGMCNGEAISEGKIYYFTVTAATKEAESPAILAKSAASADDLAPGIVSFEVRNNKEKVNSQDGVACINFAGPIQITPAKLEYRPEFNEDRNGKNEGTKPGADEKIEYLLHYSEKDKVLADLGVCEPYKCRKIADRTSVKFDEGSDVGFLNNKFKEGQKYCFTMAAKDEEGNAVNQISQPYEFAKPAQWDGLGEFRVE